jgi:hypothetical protein
MTSYSEAHVPNRPETIRRLRFSLRGLLILVTLVCLGLTWRWMQERKRQLLIREIEQIGGNVTVAALGWLPTFAGERVTSVTLPYRIKDSFGPQRLNAFPRLQVKRIENCVMIDDTPAYTGTLSVGTNSIGEKYITYAVDGLTNNGNSQ